MHTQTFDTLLIEMYEKHLPFRISMDNKATSLLVRNNRVVQQHVRHAAKQEKDRAWLLLCHSFETGPL
jgi:hypothetical protein